MQPEVIFIMDGSSGATPQSTIPVIVGKQAERDGYNYGRPQVGRNLYIARDKVHNHDFGDDNNSRSTISAGFTTVSKVWGRNVGSDRRDEENSGEASYFDDYVGTIHSNADEFDFKYTLDNALKNGHHKDQEVIETSRDGDRSSTSDLSSMTGISDNVVPTDNEGLFVSFRRKVRTNIKSNQLPQHDLPGKLVEGSRRYNIEGETSPGLRVLSQQNHSNKNSNTEHSVSTPPTAPTTPVRTNALSNDFTTAQENIDSLVNFPPILSSLGRDLSMEEYDLASHFTNDTTTPSVGGFGMYVHRKLADSSFRKKMLMTFAVVILLLVLLAAIMISVISFSSMNKVENAGVDLIDAMANENGYRDKEDIDSFPMYQVEYEDLEESTTESISQEPSPSAPTFSPIIGTASIVEGESDIQELFDVGSSAPTPSESVNFVEKEDSATLSPTISTQDPKRQPSRHPTLRPSWRPSWRPTLRPTALTPVPSLKPSATPFTEPSSAPSGLPSQKQTLSPSQSNPTVEPTVDASPRPSLSLETISPISTPKTIHPTFIPETNIPTHIPEIIVPTPIDPTQPPMADGRDATRLPTATHSVNVASSTPFK